MSTRTPPRGKDGASSHARAAKARAAEARRKRNRLLYASLASGAVVLLIVVLVAVKLSGGGSNKNPTTSTEVMQPAPADALAAVTGVPPSRLASAISNATDPPKPASGVPALTSGGHPEVFYAGANYCPYCASERWPLVMALSKFGTFSNLAQTQSSPTDAYPNTPTFSFHGASYSSPYLVFDAVELQDRFGATLEKPTAEQERLLSSYDTSQYTGASSGSIPFLDLGGRWFHSGASFVPTVLSGKSFSEIAAAAADGSTAIGKAVQSAAGQITADLCQLTNNQPTAVCSAFHAG